MYILGIFNGNNSSACLMKDGQLLFAAHEERYTRKKFIRQYPINAIESCLQYANIGYNDIKAVGIGAWSYPSYDAINDYHLTTVVTPQKKSERMYNSLKADAPYREEFLSKTAKYFKNAAIKTIDHHLSHAYTAFLPSGYSESYILTIDGRGDLQSCVVWKASLENGIHRIKTFSDLKSLGAFYGQITGLLGFTPDRHEGKVTGLAAYGKHTKLVDVFLDLIHFSEGEIVVSKNYTPFLNFDYTYLKEITQGYSKEDIAYAVQEVLEHIVLELIKYYIPEGSNLCLSGGVFGNVKLNQRIREKTSINNYYVFPEMGDGGNSVGGALAVSFDAGIKTYNIDSMYLGPSYTWDDVDLSTYCVEYFDSDTAFIETVTDMLIENKVLGLFTGRMEFGPRALGSRSILISTCNTDINTSVNKRLNRNEFMPFAPVTLKEQAPKMYLDFKEEDINVNFMTTCYRCSTTMRELSPAVVHIDNTARPQIIDASHPNTLYYQILKRYYEKTGIPSLVNTSFNNHEEPIVCTPEDALESLKKDNIDFIVTDRMLISLK